MELLLDEEMDDETRAEFLVTIREQVARLTRLATELLDLSRLDAGRIHVDSAPVDLAELAADLVEEFRAAAQAADHSLEAKTEPEAVALGDRDRLLQIGRALIENALVHTPGGTSVTVTAAADADAVVLSDADDGPGFAAEHATQVFDRFYRVDGNIASGSGLGLAIARELAMALGGRIELDSEPGRGSRFELVLPAPHAD